MKVTVFVTPKKNLLDPQGDAVGHAMASLGFAAEQVRVGKTIEFQSAGPDSPEFRAKLESLSRDLLSNPVIEEFRCEVHP
jgi:phosphoribosylformylglycinamidine synthase